MSKKSNSTKPSALMERLLKNSKSDIASILQDSDFFNNPENIPVEIPIMNVGFSGNLKDGFSSGANIIAGPSRHFKSTFGLMMVKAFQEKYKDGVVIFYDSEFGTPKSYFESLGIDMNRIIHNPIEHIEQLKFDITTQLEDVTVDDHVLIFIDSLGGLGSKKEVLDAIAGNSAADMTRAKELKGLMRIITPKLNIKKIPAIIIAHTYQTMEMFSKTVLSGGQGMMLAPNTVWFVGRSKTKDKDKVVEGYTFTIKIEKSRLVKEDSRFPIQVSFDKGIKKYSGLIDLAVGFGLVEETREGKKKAYQFKNIKVLEADVAEHEEFWTSVFKETNFEDQIKHKYTLGLKSISDTDVDFEEGVYTADGE